MGGWHRSALKNFLLFVILACLACRKWVTGILHPEFACKGTKRLWSKVYGLTGLLRKSHMWWLNLLFMVLIIVWFDLSFCIFYRHILLWYQLVHFCQEECGHVSAFWAVTFCRTTCSVSVFGPGTGASRLQTNGMEPWENSMALVAKLVWCWKPFACTCQHFRHACRTNAMEQCFAGMLWKANIAKRVSVLQSGMLMCGNYFCFGQQVSNIIFGLPMFTNKVALCSHVKFTVIWEVWNGFVLATLQSRVSCLKLHVAVVGNRTMILKPTQWLSFENWNAYCMIRGYTRVFAWSLRVPQVHHTSIFVGNVKNIWETQVWKECFSFGSSMRETLLDNACDPCKG